MRPTDTATSETILPAILTATVVILILIIAILLILLAARRAGIRQQLQEAIYKNSLNDVTLASLRAQMNPHFIFNCLNSIKLYTEQNNSAAASEYLTKFSKLIRNMLDSARAEKTALSTEIATIRLYLDMEVMRFKDKLLYDIVVDDTLDTDFIEIPPLLIQPYVENAVWHGIMHKADRGTVTITISPAGNGADLVINIEDDGIGRAKAAALKGNRSDRKSHGTQITSDRIALLNERVRSSASIVTTDLYDTYQRPAGTLVTLKLLAL